MIATEIKLWKRTSGSLNAATVLRSGRFNARNVKSIEGLLYTDGTVVSATLVINHLDASGNIVWVDNVTVDGSQTASTYSWAVEPRAQYVEAVFTSDGAATVVRAFMKAVL